MDDIFFQDPSEIPLPPDEVRIRELRLEPWPDGKRVHLYIEVDPFQKRPNLDIVVRNAQGDELASVTVIEPMSRKMEMTLHLRGDLNSLPFTAYATLFYAQPAELVEGEEPQRPKPTVVDRKEVSFQVEG